LITGNTKLQALALMLLRHSRSALNYRTHRLTYGASLCRQVLLCKGPIYT